MPLQMADGEWRSNLALRSGQHGLDVSLAAQSSGDFVEADTGVTNGAAREEREEMRVLKNG